MSELADLQKALASVGESLSRIDEQLRELELEQEATASSASVVQDGKTVYRRYAGPSAIGGPEMVHPTDLYYLYNKRSTGRRSAVHCDEGGHHTRTTSLAMLLEAIERFKQFGYNESEIATIVGTVLTNGGS